MKSKVRSTLKKIFSIATSTLSSILLLSAATGAYYYAQGYRFNFENNTIRKTGVLNVESTPSRADLYINDELIGRTPRTVASVDEGIARVTIKREGYRDWFKNVPIKAERSSPIYPYLLLSEPKKESQSEVKENFVKGYTNRQGNYIFFITENNGTHTVYRYDITRNFWDLTENPKSIYKIETGVKEIDLNISPDGRNAILTTKDSNEVESIQLLHTVRNGVVIEDIDLEGFSKDHTFTWSNDSKFIMLESETNIISFKVSDKTRYLLIRKNPGNLVTWATDTEGFIYTVEKEGSEEQTYFKLSQMLLDGTEKTLLIDRIYTKNDEKYATALRDTNQDYIPFTNALENTRFVGEIKNIAVDQETDGFFMETTEASYWYNFDLKKYILVNPYPTKFLAFSPDKRKLLFEDLENKSMGVFTFEKEESDHTTQIGSKNVLDLKENEISEISWLYNSQNLMYEKQGIVGIIDIDGENETEVIKTDSRLIMIDRRNENIYTTEGIDGLVTISRFKVN